MSCPRFDDLTIKQSHAGFPLPSPLLSLASWCFRASSAAVSRRTWCTPATETRTVRLTRSHATAASTAGCRSALRSACPRKVSPPRTGIPRDRETHFQNKDFYSLTLTNTCVHRHTQSCRFCLQIFWIKIKTRYDIPETLTDSRYFYHQTKHLTSFTQYNLIIY